MCLDSFSPVAHFFISEAIICRQSVIDTEYVAEVVRVIRDSGLPSRTTSMFTEIEGDWDEVMQVVRDATFVLASKGIRTEVVLKADIRPGFTDTMTGKLERMEAQIKKQEEAR